MGTTNGNQLEYTRSWNEGYTWGDSTGYLEGYSQDFLQRAANDEMVTMVTMPPTRKLGIMVRNYMDFQ